MHKVHIAKKANTNNFHHCKKCSKKIAKKIRIRNAPKGSTLHASLTTTTSSCGTGLTLEPEVDGVTYPTTSGSIGVVISAASSSMFNFDQASYDLEIVSTDPITFCETVTRVLQGKIKLSKEVTY
jgi:hypothetical protein